MQEWVDSNDIVVLKAYKSNDSPEVDQLLLELGNSSKAIPYYALMQPGARPVHFDGVYLSPNLFLNQLGAASPTGRTPVNLQK
jgi:hypothetical protein